MLPYSEKNKLEKNNREIMKIKGKICLNYKTEESAKLVHDSLEVDNKDYVKTEISKNRLIYKINSETLGSFLSTADELIASEIVVEKIINNIR
jgi:mRNA-degrading endonuclease RelE of RelBE toxin-antitoxin system